MPTPDVNAHFTQLQSKAVARLEAIDAKDAHQQSVPWPTSANGLAIPVLSEAKGDLATLIQTATSSLGICMIVLTPTAEGFDPNAPSLSMNSPLVVQIQEFVTTNQGNSGTKVAALTLVAFVLKRLHWWAHGVYAGSPRSQLLKAQARPFLFITDTPELTYNVAFNAPLNLNAPLAPSP